MKRNPDPEAEGGALLGLQRVATSHTPASQTQPGSLQEVQGNAV